MYKDSLDIFECTCTDTLCSCTPPPTDEFKQPVQQPADVFIGGPGTIVRRKRDLVLCTLNPRTLSLGKDCTQSKFPVLEAFALRHGIDVMSIPESRTKEDEDYIPAGCTYRFISARGTKDGNLGIGSFVSPRAIKFLIFFFKQKTAYEMRT